MSLATEILMRGQDIRPPATVSAVPERDQSTAPDDVAAQRGAAEDATGLHDIAAHERRHLWQAWRVRRGMEAGA